MIHYFLLNFLHFIYNIMSVHSLSFYILLLNHQEMINFIINLYLNILIKKFYYIYLCLISAYQTYFMLIIELLLIINLINIIFILRFIFFFQIKLLRYFPFDFCHEVLCGNLLQLIYIYKLVNCYCSNLLHMNPTFNQSFEYLISK